MCGCAEAWGAKGVINLRTAFSRDQAAKVYVQHLIAQDSKMIWDLLQVRGSA
jgi:NADPH-ferrihemoprotein reductase